LVFHDSAQQKGLFYFFGAEYSARGFPHRTNKESRNIWKTSIIRVERARAERVRGKYELRKHHKLRGPGNTHELRELELRELEL
jgi:hypothetical protein